MAIKCLQCGSQRVVPNLPLNDHYGDVGGYAKQASLAVHGAPEAWFFKDSTEGKLTADVCGDCGYVMLRVSDFRALYEKYQQGGAG